MLLKKKSLNLPLVNKRIFINPKFPIGGVNEVGGKNSCAYSLFYVKDDCKVVDGSDLEKYRGLLSKEMQQYVKIIYSLSP